MLISQWQIPTYQEIPEWFLEAVKRYTLESEGKYAAQLLWQRGIKDPLQLPGFLDPDAYKPVSPFAFGQEMKWAINRLKKAREMQEKITIWGDFDADGITATSVLWEGLGEFFVQELQLTYYIPHRVKESHGLNIPGIEKLATSGTKLIVTCDTGSTNLQEIDYATQLGIDIIITDHHTLPEDRPEVISIINPRYFAETHPLYHLSGVAVAYKLVEALYQSLPDIPQQPLENLLDLVAIGLIADLVQLSGDCRYLAQKGIQQLQKQLQNPTHPGIAKLLQLCQKTGDRPTDISFGIGPRINAISRIHGEASFGVELLTSREEKRCHQLAIETELANTRRKALQKEITEQARRKLSTIDLSTTCVIVLEDSQWHSGILGLVAGQIAQEYGRPTIVLTTAEEENNSEFNVPNIPSTNLESDSQAKIRSPQPPIPDSLNPPIPPTPTHPYPSQEGKKGGKREAKEDKMRENPKSKMLLARGSARSVNNIDLYQLVKSQEHLLHRFGGHPFAAGLSLPVDNISLFRDAINQQLKQQISEANLLKNVIQADLIVTVAELGISLFKELKLLEPCGMGNPPPKLLIKNCWFEKVRHNNAKDVRGKKVQYIKTSFEIFDDSNCLGFPGIWWEHYQDELPQNQRCDALVELDYNTYENRYEIRLIAVRITIPNPDFNNSISPSQFLLDLRQESQPEEKDNLLSIQNSAFRILKDCPNSWNELHKHYRQAILQSEKLVLAYAQSSHPLSPQEIWQQLVGIAKYLNRTEQAISKSQLQEKLNLSESVLNLGLEALSVVGFKCIMRKEKLTLASSDKIDSQANQSIRNFLEAVKEEQFQRQYFCQVPLKILQRLLTHSEI